MTIFRPAHETDLRPAYEVFYQNEVLDSPHPPSPGDVPSYLRELLHGQISPFSPICLSSQLTSRTSLAKRSSTLFYRRMTWSIAP